MIRRAKISHLAWLGVGVWCVLRAFRPILDNSFLWHVAVGRIQLDGGTVLTTDPLSYTFGGETWRTQSWLMELLYGILEKAFDLSFVPVMLAVSSLLMAVIVGVLVRRRVRTESAVILLVFLSLYIFGPTWNPRPVFGSFLLMGLLIVVIDDRRLRWTVPFLVWVWVGVHASWPIGLAYVVLRGIADSRWKDSLTRVSMCALLPLVTAHGIGAYVFLTDFAGESSGLKLMQEWATPSLIGVKGFGVFVSLVLILRGAIGGKVTERDLWVIVPFIALAVSSLRSLPMGALAMLGYAAMGIELRRSISVGEGKVEGIVAGCFAIAVGVTVAFLVRPISLDESRFPIDAATYLDNRPVFHSDVTGGYLAYAFPGIPVFIDDRVELYGEGFLTEFINVRSGKTEWAPLFEEYGVAQVLLEKESPLIEILHEAPGWLVVYSDEAFELLSSSQSGRSER